MIAVECPRCRLEFQIDQRDEDEIGRVEYSVSGDNLEPVDHDCTAGHCLTAAECATADKDANEARMDAKYNR